MSNPASALASIVPASEAKRLCAFSEELLFLLTGEETSGKMTLWIEISPPGGGPPPHFHVRDDEHFVVLEGRMNFFVDGEWKEVGPGGALYLPRGVIHAFRNDTDKPVRMLVSTSPSGFESFFSQCATEFSRQGGPNMDRIVQIGAEHGIHFVKQ